jgi:hypothetical protein
MATIVVLGNIVDGKPEWMAGLTDEESTPVNFALINYNDDRTVGLYAITGPPAVLNKIANMETVVKVLEKGKEDATLDDGVADRLSSKLARQLSSHRTAGEAAAFICQNLYSGVKVDYNSWALQDYDDYSKKLADAEGKADGQTERQ